MSFDVIAMSGAVAKIPGVAFPLFGVAYFQCSGVGSGRCLEVANKSRYSLGTFLVWFIGGSNLILGSRGVGVCFLETAAIMETMSLLMVVLLPPKEPEPFSDIFTYLIEAVFMND